MNERKYTFEVCANSVESCLAAQEGGAQRVELCAGIPEGGTTPSYGEIKTARRMLDIRLHVIIRPRGGDFLYSPIEAETMLEDIRTARKAGADGLVFGCLTPEGNIDLALMQKLMEASGDTPVTFHRAFDHCQNPYRALDELVSLGVTRILTSGQQSTAPQGASLLKDLQVYAKERIILLAGCGVNETNIRKLAQDTSIREFHFSAREQVKSRMLFTNPEVTMGSKDADEYTRDVTTSRRVRTTIEALCGTPYD